MKTHNLNKEDIVKRINSEKGFSLNYSKKLINDVIDVVTGGICEDNFILKNLGTFKLINKKKRIGRNPITGKIHIITARKSIKFVPSKKLSNLNE